MNKIITLTLNPIVDKDTTVKGFCPNSILSGTKPVYYAGEGGINVSRAIQNLGGTSVAVYLSGGPTGDHLEQLLRNAGITQEKILSPHTQEKT